MNNDRKMPGTRKEWGYKIKDGYSLSMVSDDGTTIKNDWADENGTKADWLFDEKDDEVEFSAKPEMTAEQKRALNKSIGEEVLKNAKV